MEESTVMYQEGPAISGGPIQHACCVVKPGRTFLRGMITLAWSSGVLPPGMEWSGCDVKEGSIRERRDNNIGRLRVVGVWCLLIWGRLVPVEVCSLQ